MFEPFFNGGIVRGCVRVIMGLNCARSVAGVQAGRFPGVLRAGSEVRTSYTLLCCSHLQSCSRSLAAFKDHGDSQELLKQLQLHFTLL